jgi:hypothetical protein
VGKTSVSLALVSHFTKRFGSENVGYMKAVGQQCVRVWDKPVDNDEDDNEEGQYVIIDKDVKLIRDHFGLTHLQFADMSPILIPQGYTRVILMGKYAIKIRWLASGGHTLILLKVPSLEEGEKAIITPLLPFVKVLDMLEWEVWLDPGTLALLLNWEQILYWLLMVD